MLASLGFYSDRRGEIDTIRPGQVKSLEEEGLNRFFNNVKI